MKLIEKLGRKAKAATMVGVIAVGLGAPLALASCGGPPGYCIVNTHMDHFNNVVEVGGNYECSGGYVPTRITTTIDICTVWAEIPGSKKQLCSAWRNWHGAKSTTYVGPMNPFGPLVEISEVCFGYGQGSRLYRVGQQSFVKDRLSAWKHSNVMYMACG